MQRDLMTWCTRILAGLAVLGTLSLTGCGDPPVDPTASRSDGQAEQLRERLRRGQGSR